MTVLVATPRDRDGATETQAMHAGPSSVEGKWREEDARGRRRWTTSFAIVVAFHVIPVILIARRSVPLQAVPAPPPAAVMIDMAPAPAAPRKPQPRPVDPVKPRPIVKASLPLSPLPRVPNAAVALPTDLHPEQRQTATSQAVPTPPSPPMPPVTAPQTALPQGAPEPNISAPNWQSLLLGRLERFKRYPADAQTHRQQGVAYLRFAMDRSGRVLSYRLDQSSGYDLLDREALALIQRAQPLPKPPASVPGNPVELVVPIEFSLKRHW